MGKSVLAFTCRGDDVYETDSGMSPPENPPGDAYTFDMNEVLAEFNEDSNPVGNRYTPKEQEAEEPDPNPTNELKLPSPPADVSSDLPENPVRALTGRERFSEEIDQWLYDKTIIEN